MIMKRVTINRQMLNFEMNSESFLYFISVTFEKKHNLGGYRVVAFLIVIAILRGVRKFTISL